ncbi:mucin-13-like [Rhincodon typus]|uniref:mucin-13-like n=1 Tax=Rhincodon typus TaxID=259920 RepID=UPI002030B563|nr:mucin-13-like [Rhincodon typus]
MQKALSAWNLMCSHLELLEVHHCTSNSCGDLATCVENFEGYFCECDYNYYYNDTNNTCVKGQSFGAELTLKMEFVQAMTNKTSKEYMELEKNVTSFFTDSFSSIEGYRKTLILEVRKGSVITTVSNTFTETADVNETAIENAVKKSEFYVFKNSCNTQCKGINEYIVREDNKCSCKCQAGYKRRNNECESCPFGYGGIDCKDAFQLSTVVIGVIAGVVIISMTIGLIYACARLKHIKIDEHQPLVMETKGENLTKIPRVNLGSKTMMMNKLATRDYDERSHQEDWNTYQNLSMGGDYNKKRDD